VTQQTRRVDHTGGGGAIIAQGIALDAQQQLAQQDHQFQAVGEHGWIVFLFLGKS